MRQLYMIRHKLKGYVRRRTALHTPAGTRWIVMDWTQDALHALRLPYMSARQLADTLGAHLVSCD